MTKVTRHEPGAFSWVELATTDPQGAKTFYTTLFGWSFTDGPMGPGPEDIYTRLQLGGDDVGALYPMMREQQTQGVPSFWLCYVTVASADEAARKAKALGGKVCAEPFDVMDYGRMAILQDSSGATLAVWQPGTHPGVGRFGEAGAPCWLELATRDVDSARKFYGGIFGWTWLEPKGDGMPYTEIQRDGRSMGGVYPISPEMGAMPPNWTAYFQVVDTAATASKAKSLGGKLLVEPKELPGVGRFAVVQDPQGAVFSIFQPE